MHNGPQLPTPMIDNNKSDTHQFVKWVLRPQLSANPKLLYNAEWQEMIEETIGSDKLLFLDGKTKEFVIYNEDQGKEVDNIGWLSNTYSIQPTGFGARDYTYDFKTDKMGWKDNTWWDDGEYSGYTTYGNKWNNYNRSKLVNGQSNDKDKIDLSQYKSTIHYNAQGKESHTVYTPLNHNNGAEFTSYPKEEEEKKNLPAVLNDPIMYNGKKLDWDDICYLDQDELEDLCEENPRGIARYIQEMILGGKYD